MASATIPLDLIDFSDERFRISYHFATGPLKLSLERAGLLNSLVTVNRSGRHVLLAGWKRALALKEMSSGGAAAVALPVADDLAAFRSAFYENLSFRTFTYLEKAMSVRRFLELGEEERTVISDILPQFRMPPAKAALETLRILAGDGPEVGTVLQNTNVSTATAGLLAGMTPGGRRFVAPFLAPLGRNKQTEFLEDLVDLAAKRGTTPPELLTSPEFRGIIDDRKSTPLRISERLRDALNRARNPRLWASRDSLLRSIRRLGLPPGAAIRPPPLFEEKDLELVLSFGTAEEFRRAIGELDRMSRREEFGDLFRDAEDADG